MKQLRYIALLIFIITACAAYSQQMYDRCGSIIGHYENGRIYDRTGCYVGRIESGRFYDHTGWYLGCENGDRYYDRSGTLVGYCSGKRYYDHTGYYIGSVENGYVYDRTGTRIGQYSKVPSQVVALVYLFELFECRRRSFSLHYFWRFPLRELCVGALCVGLGV